MPKPPFRRHLTSSIDLKTTYEATRAGFVALALEKNIRATPFLAEARALQEAASQARNATGLLKINGVENGLLTGADEHWKTARTALERIRQSFTKAKLNPHTFFIGAAIEKKMAEEIWNELENGVLSNAANLNEDNQVASISYWLCSL